MKDANCPICVPTVLSISPIGWQRILEIHNKEHLSQCPTCKQPINL